MIDMKATSFEKKTTVIVKFGPATDNDGYRPAEYYQVTIDPQKVSVSGEYIRFGENHGDEITGWQRCAALTVVEVIGEWKEGHAWNDQKFPIGGALPVINMVVTEAE